MKMKFYKCSVCGQIIAIVNDTGVPVVCCGKEMEELIPCSVDASLEKHVPVAEKEGGTIRVRVGSAAHPMTEAHYIQWIAIQTKNGNQRKLLHPGDAPEAVFCVCESDEVEAVYAYCNLHGLWKA